MKIIDFCQEKNLVPQEVISKLNVLCGYNFWNKQSTITDKQKISFAKIDWSKENIDLIKLDSTCTGLNLIKLKIPHELHRKPSSSNINNFSSKFDLNYIPIRQTLASRIKEIISKDNMIIRKYKLYEQIGSFSNSNLNSAVNSMLPSILEKKYNFEKLYSSEVIITEFLNYLLTHNFIDKLKFDKHKLIVNENFNPVRYNQLEKASYEICLDYIFCGENEKINRFLDLLEYYYKKDIRQVNLSDLKSFFSSIKITEYSLSVIVIIIVFLLENKSIEENGRFYIPNRPMSILPIYTPM